MNQRAYTTLNQDCQPAPIMEVQVCHAGTQKRINLFMKIDTGASRSVLPIDILEKQINANKIGEIECIDFDGRKIAANLYGVRLIIQGNTFKCAVISSHNSEYGLIGRDILSQHILRCDGPKKQFELDYSQE